jgi:hypothetical protein
VKLQLAAHADNRGLQSPTLVVRRGGVCVASSKISNNVRVNRPFHVARLDGDGAQHAQRLGAARPPRTAAWPAPRSLAAQCAPRRALFDAVKSASSSAQPWHAAPPAPEPCAIPRVVEPTHRQGNRRTSHTLSTSALVPLALPSRSRHVRLAAAARGLVARRLAASVAIQSAAPMLPQPVSQRTVVACRKSNSFKTRQQRLLLAAEESGTCVAVEALKIVVDIATTPPLVDDSLFSPLVGLNSTAKTANTLPLRSTKHHQTRRTVASR